MFQRQRPPQTGLLIAGLFWLSHGLAGDALQSHASIRQSVERFLKHTLSSSEAPPAIEIGKLDSRLRLHRCNRPLENFLPPGARRSGRITVGVRCNDAKPWKIYVSARVQVLAQVVVAKRDLPRGHRIGPRDIHLVKRDASRIGRAYVSDPKAVVGHILKRALHRERPINPNLLESPDRIERGAEVSIVATSGGIQVRMKGKALSSGDPGDIIQVQNTTSKRKLQARVVSAGVVHVGI